MRILLTVIYASIFMLSCSDDVVVPELPDFILYKGVEVPVEFYTGPIESPPIGQSCMMPEVGALLQIPALLDTAFFPNSSLASYVYFNKSSELSIPVVQDGIFVNDPYNALSQALALKGINVLDNCSVFLSSGNTVYYDGFLVVNENQWRIPFVSPSGTYGNDNWISILNGSEVNGVFTPATALVMLSTCNPTPGGPYDGTGLCD